MEAIRKLRIIIRVAIIFVILPLFLAIFENHISWGVVIISIYLLFILLRLIFFRKKKIDHEDYHGVSICYVYGVIFILFAVISSTGTIEDLKHNNSIPLAGIIVLIGLWVFGILIIYYTYQIKKEFSHIKEIQERPKNKRNIKT